MDKSTSEISRILLFSAENAHFNWPAPPKNQQKNQHQNLGRRAAEFGKNALSRFFVYMFRKSPPPSRNAGRDPPPPYQPSPPNGVPVFSVRRVPVFPFRGVPGFCEKRVPGFCEKRVPPWPRGPFCTRILVQNAPGARARVATNPPDKRPKHPPSEREIAARPDEHRTDQLKGIETFFHWRLRSTSKI